MKLKEEYMGVIALIIVFAVISGLCISMNRLRTAFYPIYSDFIGRKLERAIDAYMVVNEKSYNIYSPDMEISLTELEFEEYGDRVLEFFGIENYKTVDIIMHRDRIFFHDLMGISLDRPTQGAYIGGKINILYEDTPDLMPNVFVHELTHHVTANIARGNYPPWFAEGLALYMEYYILGYEWGHELGDISYIDILDLSDRFWDLDEYIAYRRSFEIVRDIIEVNGIEGINHFLRQLGKGTSFFKAYERVYGDSLYKY